MHGTENISPWVARWAHLVPRPAALQSGDEDAGDVDAGDDNAGANKATDGRVLDVACGAGRHLLHFLRQNRPVAGIDIARSAIEIIVNQLSEEELSRCQLIEADIENGPWPLQTHGVSDGPNVEKFAAVIVTNYLWRPLLPTLMQSVGDGGVLIYETFAAGNETVGKPSRPDFLLQPGELLSSCQQGGLRVIAYEDGFLANPARFMQRIVAVREKSSSISPLRHALKP